MRVSPSRTPGAPEPRRERLPDLLAAAQAHLTNAENTFKASGDVEASAHYARLAETRRATPSTGP